MQGACVGNSDGITQKDFPTIQSLRYLKTSSQYSHSQQSTMDMNVDILLKRCRGKRSFQYLKREDVKYNVSADDNRR